LTRRIISNHVLGCGCFFGAIRQSDAKSFVFVFRLKVLQRKTQNSVRAAVILIMLVASFLFETQLIERLTSLTPQKLVLAMIFSQQLYFSLRIHAFTVSSSGKASAYLNGCQDFLPPIPVC